MSCLVSAYCYLNNIEAVSQFICLFEIIKVDGPQNAFLNVYVSYMFIFCTFPSSLGVILNHLTNIIYSPFVTDNLILSVVLQKISKTDFPDYIKIVTQTLMSYVGFRYNADRLTKIGLSIADLINFPLLLIL